MLAKLKGILDYKDDDHIIIDVNGVGYEVFVPNSSVEAHDIGAEVCYFIHTVVREDAFILYGFPNILDKKLFNLLTTVPGVGPKIGLSMLSKLSCEQIVQAILLKDDNILKNIPGIGSKVAQRMVNELKDKITKIPLLNQVGLQIDITNEDKNSAYNNYQDAILALQGLGYTFFEVNKAIKGVKDKINDASSTEYIIKEVLSYFSSKDL